MTRINSNNIPLMTKKKPPFTLLQQRDSKSRITAQNKTFPRYFSRLSSNLFATAEATTNSHSECGNNSYAL